MRTFLVLVCLFAAVPSASAQSTVNLAWDASVDPTATGYLVSWGVRPGEFPTKVDVGSRTDWTVTGLEPYQNYYFTVQAYNAEGALSSPADAVSNNGILVQTGGRGVIPDDRPSLFWHNKTTGDLFTWHLAGENVLDTRLISIPGADPKWTVAGTGDLNGDGFSDMLWRHADGWLATWYLQGNGVIFTGYLSINRIMDAKWRIAGVGDVDGDRHADIVWQHADGWLAVWFLQGTNVVSTRFLSIPRMTDPQWHLAAVGDLDRDGKADLVWQSTQGWLATWLLDGTTVKQTTFFSINRMLDSRWEIAAAGSTTAGAPPALVWRNREDGTIALWYVNGPTVVGTLWLKPDRVADPDWKIVGAR